MNENILIKIALGRVHPFPKYLMTKCYNRNMAIESAEHLAEIERIQLGAFYTPEDIVKLVRKLVEPYLDIPNAIVLDPAGGCGAFIEHFQDTEYRVADIDNLAVEYLKWNFDPSRVFLVNSLLNVSRANYKIPEEAFLIIVGNPPYNDWTSLYKKGRKGSFDMDKDVFDRDVGIAFLKAMAKLNTDVICLLHPLSYLIKKANFKRLSSFFRKYKLKDAYIFPSFWFKHTSRNVGFPILVALYEKDYKGLSEEELREYEFKILSGGIFKLKNYQTTDNYINKYPRRGESTLGLYFHTFRDLNSLLRNKDFMIKQTCLSIPVNIESLPKYAYLSCLKYYILKKGTKNFWLFGNLSPLIDIEFFEKNKNIFIWYAFHRNQCLRNVLEKRRQEIETVYPFQEDSETIEEYFRNLYNVEKS